MNIREFLKGIIIGIAKIIPGLSGAVLMISFNLYDRAIAAITNLFDNFKENVLFLLNLGMGIIVGIVLFSGIIHYFMTNYFLYTMALFIGMIMGGIPVVKREVNFKKHFLWTLLAFSLMFLLNVINPEQVYVLKNNYMDSLVFFGAGFLEAVGTILPGISATALLMLLGVYQSYLLVLSRALNLVYFKETLYYLLPFSGGLFLGIILLAIVVDYLFKNYKDLTFACILGVSLASVCSLMETIFSSIENGSSFFWVIVLILLGSFLTKKLS